MTKLSEEFELELSVQAAAAAAQEAVGDVGWKLKSSEPNRLVTKIGMGLVRNPSSIEVLLAPAGADRTTITLNGKIGGLGPIQKRQLSGEMELLQGAIKTAAGKASA